MTRLRAFADALKASFVVAEPSHEEPVPPHVGKPDRSIFRVITESTFNQMSTKEILETFSNHCIVITDRVVQPVKFDEQGLQTLSTLSTVVAIQGIVPQYTL